MNEKELHKKRKRIQKLSHLTLAEIGTLQNAWALAPNVMKVLTKAGLSDIGPIIGLKAVYIQSLTEKKEDLRARKDFIQKSIISLRAG